MGFVVTPILVAILGFVSTLVFNSVMKKKRQALLKSQSDRGHPIRFS
jgi:hypothetical protein